MSSVIIMLDSVICFTPPLLEKVPEETLVHICIEIQSKVSPTLGRLLFLMIFFYFYECLRNLLLVLKDSDFLSISLPVCILL